DKEANEALLLEGLEKGKLTFSLHGKKLRGEFALVKMRGRKNEDNAWLLIKHDDGAADTEQDITDEDRSVLSRRTLDEIAGDKKVKVWRLDHEEEADAEPDKPAVDWADAAHKAGGREAPFPQDARPQLATLVDEPF